MVKKYNVGPATAKAGSGRRSMGREIRGRGICQKCGANVAAVVPKGGDGTLLVPVWHKVWQRNMMVPCQGRFREIIEIPQVVPEQ